MPQYEFFRTPGYPLFLAFFHVVWGIPLNGILFLQIALTMLAAFITYLAAIRIDPRLGLLSAAIILFDPTITVFSLLLLTESLFLLFLSLFLWSFIIYLQRKRMKWIVLAAVLVVMATFTRPINFYLGGAVGILIFYAQLRSKDFKKAFVHTISFCVIVYSCLYAWQYRNYIRSGYNTFSSVTLTVTNANLGDGLYKSYTRNHDTPTQVLTPITYYINAGVSSFLSLMTRPSSFKYFKSYALKVVGKVLEYPWIAFWILGLITGLTQIRGNIFLQGIVLVILYFIVVSVMGAGFGTSARFRVPMMPFIAILSSWGWLKISRKLLTSFVVTSLLHRRGVFSS